MLKFVILGLAISAIIIGIGYVIYYLQKSYKSGQPLSPKEKRGLLAALAAVVLGAIVVYKQTKKN